MSERAERLRRLLGLRRLNEELERRVLGRALASVAEVESGLERQKVALAESHSAARLALSSGDRGEWLIAEAQSEVAGWNRGKLSVLHSARTEQAAGAMERFLNSRREFEQAKQLVTDAQQVARRDGDRRAQASADDWFLSRRAKELTD